MRCTVTAEPGIKAAGVVKALSLSMHEKLLSPWRLIQVGLGFQLRVGEAGCFLYKNLCSKAVSVLLIVGYHRVIVKQYPLSKRLCD
ncbi:hypothetical protein AMELA_G00256050 [Ameiurus melas]|uniref:Uncharacterized protein n=1 Tax=Ameiurus melas TaxID=219545 RepID=A0A7J5ZRC1_AMEME|nr:hypothetical protein AMELA_G00256050 [Ameiurus melas]